MPDRPKTQTDHKEYVGSLMETPTANTPEQRAAHPVRFFIIIIITAVSIFLTEVVIMFVIALLPPHLVVPEAFLDAALLTIIVFPILYVAVFRPLRLQISLCRQAEDNLSLFKDLINQSNDAVFVIDPESGRFLDANNKACTSMGYAREELLNMAVKDIEVVIPDDFSWNSFVDNIKEKEYILLEGGHKRKDGSSFPVEINVKFITVKGGDYLIAVARDITERKKAEKELMESEEKFRNIFETSNDAIMLLDNKSFLDCNDNTLKIFGCSSREEFIGRHPSEYSPSVQPDGRNSKKAADEKIATAFREGRNFFEWEHRRANGEDFPAEVLLTPFKLEGRSILQATVRDITDRKKLENKLKELSEVDALTNIYNRRMLFNLLEAELNRAKRYKGKFSLIMFDIDYFKDVNDIFGHDIGDYVLKAVVDVVKNAIRRTDVLARYGGEEFLVIYPESSVDEGKILAEKIRSLVERKNFRKVEMITVSLGVTSFKEDDTVGGILKRVDEALYMAKSKGRNRAEILP